MRDRQIRPASVESMGSGFIFNAEGMILTAAHVVQAADKIVVELADKRRVEAFVVGSSVPVDVAVIQMVEPPPAEWVATMGDSDAVAVGEPVFVVGAPYGASHTLSVGHISALRVSQETVDGFTPIAFLQTDAAINQGNSGGPMFNVKGEVIGIVSHIMSKTGGFEGLGFAAPINLALSILIERRSVWNGVEGRVLDEAFCRLFQLPQQRAFLVERVADGSPSAMLGLRGGLVPATIGGREMLLGGDIVLGALGISLAEEQFREKIFNAASALKLGDSYSVTVWRNGQVRELNVPFLGR